MSSLGYWQAKPPVWLRALIGVLLFPIGCIAIMLLLEAWHFVPPKSALTAVLLTIAIALAGAVLAGLTAWKVSRLGALFLGVLIVTAYALIAIEVLPPY